MPILSVGKTRTPRRKRLRHHGGSAICKPRGAGASACQRVFQQAFRTQKLGTRSGVTLIEMLVVVVLISLVVGISFPALSSGVDSLRLNAATNGVVSFVNSGLSRAERRQQVVEIVISKSENALSMRSTEPGFFRKLELPDGVSITHVLPELPENPDAPRIFMLYPGGTAPRFGVQLMNRRGVERIVRVDPITGVPRVEKP